jgi:hypothetical protein
MSGVFRNINGPTLHPLTARRVKGEDTLAGWRGGGGSIVRKTPDTSLYSIYVSTLCLLCCIHHIKWEGFSVFSQGNNIIGKYRKRKDDSFRHLLEADG